MTQRADRDESCRVGSSGVSSSTTRGWRKPRKNAITSIMMVIEIQLERPQRQQHATTSVAIDTYARAAAEDDVGDVAAVELAERQQVQRRREHAPPRGERHRVQRRRRGRREDGRSARRAISFEAAAARRTTASPRSIGMRARLSTASRPSRGTARARRIRRSDRRRRCRTAPSSTETRSRIRITAPNVPVSRKRRRQEVGQRRVDVVAAGSRSSGRTRARRESSAAESSTRGRRRTASRRSRSGSSTPCSRPSRRRRAPARSVVVTNVSRNSTMCSR